MVRRSEDRQRATSDDRQNYRKVWRTEEGLGRRLRTGRLRAKDLLTPMPQLTLCILPSAHRLNNPLAAPCRVRYAPVSAIPFALDNLGV
jgi:hypothetical protein